MPIGIPNFGGGGYMNAITRAGVRAAAMGSFRERKRQARLDRAGQYNAKQIGLEQQGEKERMRREGALADLDKAWGSPERMAGMEKLYGTQLQGQLAGLQQGYRQQSQGAGLAAARRGRLGSSTDIETQSRLQHGLQQDVAGAENESYGNLQAMKTADEQQRLALRNAILSGDPQTAAALQAQAQGSALQTQGLLQRQMDQAQATQRREQEMRDKYNLMGDVATSVGKGYEGYTSYQPYKGF